MDVEKTIHAERIARLESAIAQLANSQVHLDETVSRYAETIEGFKHTDQRIRDLVSAIGEMLHRTPPN